MHPNINISQDEGSYALDEPKQPPRYMYSYQKAPTKEFYA